MRGASTALESSLEHFPYESDFRRPTGTHRREGEGVASFGQWDSVVIMAVWAVWADPADCAVLAAMRCTGYGCTDNETGVAVSPCMVQHAVYAPIGTCKLEDRLQLDGVCMKVSEMALGMHDCSMWV